MNSEHLVGFVDLIEGDIAYVTVTDEKGKEVSFVVTVDKLNGTKEGRSFNVYFEGENEIMVLEPWPEIEIPPEVEKEINDRIDALFEGGFLDGDD